MELFDVRFGKFAVVLLDNVVYGAEMVGGFDDVVYINRFIRHSDRVGFPSIGKFDSDIISTTVVLLLISARNTTIYCIYRYGITI